MVRQAPVLNMKEVQEQNRNENGAKNWSKNEAPFKKEIFDTDFQRFDLFQILLSPLVKYLQILSTCKNDTCIEFLRNS